MKITLRLAAVLFITALCVSAGEGNLLPNIEFKSSNGATPDLWNVSQSKPAEKIFKVTTQEKSNILEINENSQSFVNSISYRLNVDGFKSFEINADVKLEDISKNAAIIYYWLDQDGKFIDGAKCAYSGKGNSEWNTVEKIIAPDNPVATKGILLCLCVYGKPDDNGKAMFKNVSMTLVDKQEKKSATITSTANNQPQTLKESSFRDNFTDKPKGEPYYISRGEYRVP